jgi:hypothetical protein
MNNFKTLCMYLVIAFCGWMMLGEASLGQKARNYRCGGGPECFVESIKSKLKFEPSERSGGRW